MTNSLRIYESTISMIFHILRRCFSPYLKVCVSVCGQVCLCMNVCACTFISFVQNMAHVEHHKLMCFSFFGYSLKISAFIQRRRLRFFPRFRIVLDAFGATNDNSGSLFEMVNSEPEINSNFRLKSLSARRLPYAYRCFTLDDYWVSVRHITI